MCFRKLSCSNKLINIICSTICTICEMFILLLNIMIRGLCIKWLAQVRTEQVIVNAFKGEQEMKITKLNKVNFNKESTPTLCKFISDFYEHYLEIISQIDKAEKYTTKMNTIAKQKKIKLCNEDFEKYMLKNEQSKECV